MERHGLNEAETLKLEYENTKYYVNNIYKYDSAERAPYEAKLEEIKTKLKAMGYDTEEKMDDLMYARVRVANFKSEVAQRAEKIKYWEKQIQELTARLNEAGIKLPDMTVEEM